MTRSTFNGASHFYMTCTPVISGYTVMTPRQIRTRIFLEELKARLSLWSLLAVTASLSTLTAFTV